MPAVIVYVDDLMLASRVVEPLRSSGFEVESGTCPEGAGGADLIVCDLDSNSAEVVAGLGPPVIGFHSHLDAETGRAAREAGIDFVVPRSRMAREIVELARSLTVAP